MRNFCVIVALLCSASSVACKGTTDASHHEDAGAPKAWLDVCRKDADCATGMFCECGVCSKSCMKRLDCATVSPSAVCGTSIPTTSLCDLSVKLEPICVIECKTNSDCLSLGERGVCSSEWCRRATADSVVDGSLLDCVDQRGLIDDALKPTLDDADRSCASDTDCRRVTLSNKCYGDGCSGEYVSRGASEQITAKLAALEDEFCPTAFKAGCVGRQRISCPLQRIPKCVAGTCQAEQ